jgi:hypothetical protein
MLHPSPSPVWNLIMNVEDRKDAAKYIYQTKTIQDEGGSKQGTYGSGFY